VLRIGLWLLPAMAALMAASAAPDAARTVIYAVTPMGMTAAAEGMAFLARRIVVHTEGHDAEAQARAAKVIRSLAYHRARAANHPNARVQKRSEKLSWRL
ncbi:conjugal transfer protein, partial [Streptomyces sp. SID11233]|nr:conjugal transfer protein [Streptomyces sp. SID11233]